MMKPTSETIKSYCNDCLQITNHDLIANRHRTWDITATDGIPVDVESMDYDFLQCCGCENVSLRRTYRCPPGYDEERIDYFPPAVSRRKPKWLSELLSFVDYKEPKMQIRELMSEVYSALFSGNNRLVMMGARTIVDIALTDKLGDIGGFANKLDEAERKGWITPSHRKVLATAIDAGSAAAHRGYRPEKKHLDLVLDIVEHVIQLLYVLEANAETLAKQTPKRGTKKPPPTT